MQVAADYWLARGKSVPPNYRSKVLQPAAIRQSRGMLCCSTLGRCDFLPSAPDSSMYHGSVSHTVEALLQVQLMCRYLNPNGKFRSVMEVPDPYYGGKKGFELVGALCSRPSIQELTRCTMLHWYAFREVYGVAGHQMAKPCTCL